MFTFTLIVDLGFSLGQLTPFCYLYEEKLIFHWMFHCLVSTHPIWWQWTLPAISARIPLCLLSPGQRLVYYSVPWWCLELKHKELVLSIIFLEQKFKHDGWWDQVKCHVNLKFGDPRGITTDRLYCKYPQFKEIKLQDGWPEAGEKEKSVLAHMKKNIGYLSHRCLTLMLGMVICTCFSFSFPLSVRSICLSLCFTVVWVNTDMLYSFLSLLGIVNRSIPPLLAIQRLVLKVK